MSIVIRWASTAAAVALTAIVTLAQQTPAGTPPAGAPQTPAPGGRQNVPGSFQRLPPLPFPDAPQEYELSGTCYRVVRAVKDLIYLAIDGSAGGVVRVEPASAPARSTAIGQ
jgi:hypothetical protein